MREIKFRAWIKNKKFGREMFDVVMISWVGQKVILSGRGGSVSLDECELMQYTGRKDKNDKEIYEGDIVRHYLWGIAIVKFGEGTNIGGGDSSAYFYGYYLEIQNRRDTWGDNEVDSGCFRDTSEIEVIGNIYENPELLKEAK